MSDVFTHAGPLGYLVLLGTILGLVACGGAGAVAFTKRRVPLSALLLVPYALLAVGAFGAWVATTGVLGAVAEAEPNRIPVVAMGGAWNAMMVDWLARWCAAFVLVAATWAAAVGSAVVPGPETRFTPVAAGGAAAASAIGSLVIAVVAYRGGLGASAYMLVFVVLVGGLGVAAAATRRATDDEMWRVAGMRFAASIAMLMAVFHALRAVDIGNRITAFAADGALLNASDLTEAIRLFSATVDPGVTIGFVALFFAVIVAFFGFFAELGEVVVRYTVFDMFAVVALLVGIGLFRIIESIGFSSVYVVATNKPAVEMYQDLGAELAVSMISRGEGTQIVRMADGGYGDVYAFEFGEWVRKFRWNGRKWVEDSTKLADAPASDRPPLIAVDRGMDADQFLPVLEKGGGQGFLMMRASEVKAGTFVPPEVARLQTTFLPIRTGTTRDLKTELWVVAGSPEVNYGPTTWFGEHFDSLDPYEYASSALSTTQAPAINVIVAGRKVGDVVTSCLPYLLDGEVGTPAAEGEGGSDAEGAPAALPPLTMNATRFCALTTDEYETLRTEAAGVWELPHPENVSMSVTMQAPVADPAAVQDLVRRELGGIGYCGEAAVKAGEVLQGRMSLQLALSKDGHVYDTLVDEKSKLQSPAILSCAAKRFRKLEFAMTDAPPPPPPKPAKKGRGGRAAPPEAPAVPRVLVDLDFR